MIHPAKSVALSLALALTLSAGASGTGAESGPLAAEVRDLAGTPTLFVDGKPHSPLMFFGSLGVGGGPVLEEVRLAAKAGVHIHSIGVPMPWAAEGETPDYTLTDACLDAVLKADPDALLLPRFMMDPPAAWTQQHRCEAMLYDNGSRGRASVASETWRREANLSLRRFVEHVESKYGQHVIGYHPCGQHTGEWFYDETWTPRLSGFEPAFERGFRAFLRNKYAGNLEALRRAWRDETAAFDAIRVPTKDQRTLAALGVFHEPTSEKKLIDWHEYLQIAMVEPLELFARTIKEATKGKKLVVYFYGYMSAYN